VQKEHVIRSLREAVDRYLFESDEDQAELARKQKVQARLARQMSSREHRGRKDSLEQLLRAKDERLLDLEDEIVPEKTKSFKPELGKSYPLEKKSREEYENLGPSNPIVDKSTPDFARRLFAMQKAGTMPTAMELTKAADAEVAARSAPIGGRRGEHLRGADRESSEAATKKGVQSSVAAGYLKDYIQNAEFLIDVLKDTPLNLERSKHLADQEELLRVIKSMEPKDAAMAANIRLAAFPEVLVNDVSEWLVKAGKRPVSLKMGPGADRLWRLFFEDVPPDRIKRFIIAFKKDPEEFMKVNFRMGQRMGGGMSSKMNRPDEYLKKGNVEAEKSSIEDDAISSLEREPGEKSTRDALDSPDLVRLDAERKLEDYEEDPHNRYELSRVARSEFNEPSISPHDSGGYFDEDEKASGVEQSEMERIASLVDSATRSGEATATKLYNHLTPKELQFYISQHIFTKEMIPKLLKNVAITIYGKETT
jgi:hypothetical protein